MKFIKIKGESLIDLHKASRIKIDSYENSICYYFNGYFVHEKFDTWKEAEARFEEIQKLLGIY